MKSIQSMLGAPQKHGKQARLTEKTKNRLIGFAQEAYRNDPSRSIQCYYVAFLNRLRKQYKESNNKQEFYEKGIIELC